VGVVIARRPKADAAISYPSKAEAIPPAKRLTMMPTVSIVMGYYVLIKTRLVWVFVLETVSLSTIQYSDSVSLMYIVHRAEYGVK
jgi:hypothetical protein